MPGQRQDKRFRLAYAFAAYVNQTLSFSGLCKAIENEQASRCRDC